jgi:hypothetical protein
MTDANLPQNSLMPPSLQAPFFIIGCVRSGTTMLRNMLRRHPNLACPEETHFYRWSEPFGTDAYTRIATNNAVLKRHRELDEVTEDEFAQILAESSSRRELCERYMALYVAKRKPQATRWFDKSPQNFYGAAMLGSWPGARFVHIVRNPEEVVASLRIGKVIKISPLLGAANYWNEAVESLATLRAACPHRVFEVRYEDFVAAPQRELARLCAFLEEPYDAAWFAGMDVREVSHADEAVLSDEERHRVRALCRTGMLQYGYPVD